MCLAGINFTTRALTFAPREWDLLLECWLKLKHWLQPAVRLIQLLSFNWIDSWESLPRFKLNCASFSRSRLKELTHKLQWSSGLRFCGSMSLCKWNGLCCAHLTLGVASSYWWIDILVKIDQCRALQNSTTLAFQFDPKRHSPPGRHSESSKSPRLILHCERIWQHIE